MKASIEFLPSGTVTSPAGFYAGATDAGIKGEADSAQDLGMLFSEATCTAAAVFTTNKIKAAPVALSHKRLRDGQAQAVVINSGNANACTGRRGYGDAVKISALVAAGLGIAPEDVLVASTGIIGTRLPMKRIQGSLDKVILSRNGGHELAEAIMTTDTVPKETAVTVKAGEDTYTIGGIAKGSGMIHPDLATMLCFLTTDANVDASFLRLSLRRAVDNSFNMISVDGDTSTNDMVLVMANGLAGEKPITPDSELADTFQQALEQVCTFLAKCIARDGEGASRLIEVTVRGARNISQARRGARTVVSSPLVKTAIHGGDPNWGRIFAALGRSGARVAESKIDLDIGGTPVVRAGKPAPFHRRRLKRILNHGDVAITVDLNLGVASATAWGCDLSAEYVTINSQYTT